MSMFATTTGLLSFFAIVAIIGLTVGLYIGYTW